MRRNSSTSSSRRQAKRWALLLGLVLLGLLLADATLVWYARQRVSADAFIEDARSKARHMRLRLAGTHADIIFVGSSRTLHHISTADFQRAGWTVYNYGISGHQIASYPSMVEAAAALGPTYVAIGVPLAAFGSAEITVPSRPALADIRAQIATGQPLRLLAATTGEWLGNLHALHFYSEALNLRLRPLFERLNRSLAPQPRPRKKDTNPGQPAGVQAPAAAPGAPEETCDCIPFGSLTDERGMRILKCTNGDGILFGNFLPQGKARAIAWQGFHEPYLALLNHCLDLARAQGARPVVILEPNRDLVYNQDLADILEAIRAAVHAPVLDFTHHPLPDAMWADAGHLNDAGRHAFSAALAEAFAALPAP